MSTSLHPEDGGINIVGNLVCYNTSRYHNPEAEHDLNFYGREILKSPIKTKGIALKSNKIADKGKR
jgi:hypothetical protein